MEWPAHPPLEGGGGVSIYLSYHVYFSQAVIWHPTPSASKDVKFRLSQNLTKFDVVCNTPSR